MEQTLLEKMNTARRKYSKSVKATDKAAVISNTTGSAEARKKVSTLREQQRDNFNALLIAEDAYFQAQKDGTL